MQPIVKINEFIEAHSEDKTQANAMKMSVIGTGILWLLILLFLAISPFFRKPVHYNTVQITLEPLQEQKLDKAEKVNPALSKVDDAKAKEAAAPKKEEKVEQKQKEPAKQKAAETKKTEPVKKTENAPVKQTQPQKTEQKKAEPAKPKVEPAPAAAQKAQNAPVQKKVEESKPSASPKSETPQPKAAEQPKKAVIKYKKSLDELMEEQAGSKTSNEKKWDDSMFDNSSAVTNESSSAVSNSAKALAGTSALSGTAAAATTNDSGAVTSKSTAASKNTSATSATSDMLSKISATTYSMSAGNGLSSTSNVQVAKSTDGKLALALSDGSSRVLLDPAKPVILISEENGKLIDSTRQVVITFKILASGNVPFSGIGFTPAAALPQAIQSEIKEQVSKWRFAPANSDGQAKFDYSIIKR